MEYVVVALVALILLGCAAVLIATEPPAPVYAKPPPLSPCAVLCEPGDMALMDTRTGELVASLGHRDVSIGFGGGGRPSAP